MSGDYCYEDCTCVSYAGTTYTTSSTSMSEPFDSNSTATYTYVNVRTSQEDYELELKIKELLRKEIIKKMKATWSQFIPLIKSKPLRPSIQLRGVCFGGRGWA